MFICCPDCFDHYENHEHHLEEVVSAQAAVIEAMEQRLNVCWSTGHLGLKAGRVAFKQEQEARARLAEVQHES